MLRLCPAHPRIAAALVLLGVNVCLASELSDSQRRIRELEATQRELIMSLCCSNAAATESPKCSKSDNALPRCKEAVGRDAKKALRAEEIARDQALINKLLKEYSPRPRKGFASPNSEDPALVSYLAAWGAQLEQYGTQHFPRDKGQSLYGSVQALVAVDAKGRLIKAKLIRASADARLNDAALKLIREAAPFAPFAREISEQYEILEFVRTISFTREEVGDEALLRCR